MSRSLLFFVYDFCGYRSYGQTTSLRSSALSTVTYWCTCSISTLSFVAMSRMMFELLDRNLFDVLTDEEKEVLAEIMRKLDDRADRIMESLTKG